MIFYSRRFWGARTPRPMQPQEPPTEAFVHHSENPHAERVKGPGMAAAMRAIQNFHMDVRGWSDIAYHYVIFQHQSGQVGPEAHVFCGRDPHYVPAAQLNHNTRTLAICVFGNFLYDNVHAGTLEAIAACLEQHHELQTVGGHRDVTQTDCPGPHLYGRLDAIAKLSHLRRYPH